MATPSKQDNSKDNVSELKQRLKAELLLNQDSARDIEPAEDLRFLTSHQRLDEFKFSSQVPVLGPFISTFREMWNSISTKWYVRHFAQQQSEFNSAVVAAIRLLEGSVNTFREEIKWLDDMRAESDQYATKLNTWLGSLSIYLERVENERRVLEMYAVDERLKSLERKLLDTPHKLIPTSAADAASPLDQTLHIDSWSFSQKFRGPVSQIKEQQRAYLEFFASQEDVLDVGCGRGEFLDLLKEIGVPARGVEMDDEMVQHCMDRGLEVVHGDALSHLSSLPDGSLGGVFSAQVIEHLPPQALLELIHLSYRKLRPGGVFLAETNNPMCLWAMSTHFVIDMTHQRPVHPETLKFLLESTGFANVTLKYSSPVPEELRLKPLVVWENTPSGGPGWIATLNSNLARLNDILFGYQDYAAVGWKGED